MSTVDALASALPGGITYDIGGGQEPWDASWIAEFQAKRLAESGYRLVGPADESKDWEQTLQRLGGTDSAPDEERPRSRRLMGG